MVEGGSSEVRSNQVGRIQFSLMEGGVQRCLRRINLAEVGLDKNGSSALCFDQNGVVQPSLAEIGIVQYRTVQNGHPHVGGPRIRLHEARPFEVDTLQISLLKACRLQICESEIRSTKQRPAKIGFRQIGSVEIGAFQIRFHEASPLKLCAVEQRPQN